MSAGNITAGGAKIGRGIAHAKAILLGEHAVVYGYPALALPIKELALQVTAKQLEQSAAEQAAAGLAPQVFGADASPASMENELSTAALREVLQFLQRPQAQVEINIEGSIPTARGLGSSAAMSSAIAQAVTSLFGYELKPHERFELVQAVEKIAHGTPSGLDAYATMAEGLIWFQQGQAEAIQSAAPLHLVVADSGIAGRTLQAVSGLRELKTARPEFVDPKLAEIGKLAQAARNCLESGQLAELGALLDYCHLLLKELELSHPVLEQLVTAAKTAGALGAKLTGGGLGGCMLAQAADPAAAAYISQALLDAGAKQVWHLNLNS